MKKNMILILVASLALLLVSCTGVSEQTRTKDAVTLDTKAGSDLFIPPLLDNLATSEGVFEGELVAKEGEFEFFEGVKTKTYGYNQAYLGPTIKLRRGVRANLTLKNELDEPTTIHWHGLIVDGQNDGGPHQIIEANDSWSASFTLDQPAATLWYHPHLDKKTGVQVFKGLAGIFLVEDNESIKLPSEYGVDDIPLVIQDRRFGEGGQLVYIQSHMDVMRGVTGNVLLVNGQILPKLKVKTSLVRLRIINGANARIMTLKIPGVNFKIVGSDGGLLDSPVPAKSIKLAPGERSELILDFSNSKKGSEFSLEVENIKALTFEVLQEIPAQKISERLTDIARLDERDAVVTRKFSIEQSGTRMTINGKSFDIDRIDEFVKLGDVEIWEITNKQTGRGMMGSQAHPFHVHGVQFQILDKNSKVPPLYERGWKDTVLINPGDNVRIILRFTKKGKFMYHCHILEHEDAGMMGQIQVD